MEESFVLETVGRLHIRHTYVRHRPNRSVCCRPNRNGPII